MQNTYPTDHGYKH